MLALGCLPVMIPAALRPETASRVKTGENTLKTTTAHLCRIAFAASLLALIAACTKAPQAETKTGTQAVSLGSMDEAPLKDADTSCKSACLEDLMQKYLDALAARNPAAAPGHYRRDLL